ncbi:MAG: glycoside hydrolase family 3 protein [Candidatus Microthrix sp.]|uniref:beta-N-acetylhexosaminidase n=1 Tax=Candidatus Neomicrothrix subdominans TaxID=2954438 RepID=A0A936NDR8_9ACTN|nr:glycoside hydrolase family 3 protein [Candidatus Microthrix subdominans]
MSIRCRRLPIRFPRHERWAPGTLTESGEAAEGHGAQLRAHAVNVNFAPMLDLTGPREPLGDRTWSSDPATVTATAERLPRGCAPPGYPTFKHFPGHGHSDVDADYEPATTPDLATIEAADLLPSATSPSRWRVAQLIMTGHLDVPGLTTEGRPFSLDPGAMAYLRNNVGFDGVAVTDELAEMGSITQRGIGVDEAIELSLVAGNDMALFFGGPGDL